MRIIYGIFLAFIILIGLVNEEGLLGTSLMGCAAIWALTILMIR